MAIKPILTAEQVRHLLHYDPDTGVFTWRNAMCSQNRTGQIAGSSNGCGGYVRIGIGGHNYLAHQLAWLYMKGQTLPRIDHRDNDRSNNRWRNLRPATRSQNAFNQQRSIRNASGFKGVSLFRGRYRAMIKVAGKSKHIGVFDTAEQAHAAYMVEATKHAGEYARAA